MCYHFSHFADDGSVNVKLPIFQKCTLDEHFDCTIHANIRTSYIHAYIYGVFNKYSINGAVLLVGVCKISALDEN